MCINTATTTPPSFIIYLCKIDNILVLIETLKKKTGFIGHTLTSYNQKAHLTKPFGGCTLLLVLQGCEADNVDK